MQSFKQVFLELNFLQLAWNKISNEFYSIRLKFWQ